MPRIVKHPDTRRAEFIDHAEALFLRDGYERVSLNEVIAAAGASKGAFYHWFPSKEALLEALAERFARNILAAAQEKGEVDRTTALNRLNGILARARRYKLDVADQRPSVLGPLGALFQPENLALAERVNSAVATVFVPALAEIIGKGMRDGEFSGSDPQGVAEMVLHLTNMRHAVLGKADPSATNVLQTAVTTLEKRLALCGIALDRLLGVPDGSIVLLEPGYVCKMMAATLSVTRNEAAMALSEPPENGEVGDG